MTPMVIMLLAWWIVGTTVVIYEMQRDIDVTLGWMLFAMLVGILGPLWLWKTLFRLTNDIVLIRKGSMGPNQKHKE